MKRLITKTLALCIFVLLGFTSYSQDITGDWYGTGVFPHVTLRIVFHVQKDGEEYILIGDVPDQYAYGWEMGGLSVDGDKFTIKIAPPVDIFYNGIVSKDGKSIEGDFIQHGNTIPLKLTRKSNITPEDAITKIDAIAIRALIQKFNQATKTNHLEGLMDTYDEYALLMAPFGEEPLREKSNIREITKEQMENNPSSDASYDTPYGLKISGDIAYATGNYNVVRNGEAQKGRFLHVFKKYEDGSWKISVDIWNILEN